MRLTDDLYAFTWEGYENNCNTYFFGGELGVLIDPGHLRFADSLLARLAAEGISTDQIRLVIVTHSHPDHMEAIPHFSDLGIQVAMHPAARDYVRELGTAIYSWMGSKLPAVDGVIPLEEGQVELLNGLLTVYHTPGHEPGSICVYWPEKRALATGDLVFSGSIGRTDFPGGNHARLMAEVERMGKLDTEYFLPGHGPVLIGEEAIQTNYAQILALFR